MNTLSKSKNSTRNSYVTDDDKWRAVLTHDRHADGQFYFSVKTTGVYCLPSCRSRTPLRKNVAFHAAAEDAEKAGFRPCKRCSPTGLSRSEEHGAAVAKACRAIQDADELPGLDALARVAGMSSYHFHRTFKSITGLTPKEYAVAHRSQRVRRALSNQRATVTEAIYEAGFKSNGRFYEKSSETLGMTPSAFRSGGVDMTIYYATEKCSLGLVIVATTEKGVCFIGLGDTRKELVGDLQRRFPKARLVEGDKDFGRTVAKVVAFVEAPKTGLDLPLDVRGTAFQQKVWRALQAIPFGSTSTYAEIAKQIGAPKAVRAVAGACAANKLALVIPCHRVLRDDGALSGYYWGVDRKRALLKKEGAA
jgi:AraC family transcriptional regulator, regulatory protein of adaptative response / methylated-DNA-[protein]-cysteine methyltransferase